MGTRKSIWVFFGILAITAWIVGLANQAGAETLNYKFYSYVIKYERFPIGDVEGHAVSIFVRNSFCMFENGEVGTTYAVSIGDETVGAASFTQYLTLTFADGSTIVRKDQGTRSGGTTSGVYTASSWTSEIIKGTGRFEGIKGTHTAKGKFLPVEKWEAGPKNYGEGTYTYTLPSK